jgi:phosphoribosylformylglycinamidine synthase I
MQSSMFDRRAPNIGIIAFPGSNCDRDVHFVLNNILKVKADLIWHKKNNISHYGAIIIPGGFTYGDRLRAGLIAAHSPIIREIKKMAKEGVPILGICNGFQILVESCLLPGALIRNTSLNFVCRWTTVQVHNNKTPFTIGFSKHQKVSIPIAHGEGRYLVDTRGLGYLKKKNQIVLRYVNDDPNGSMNLVAAVCNEEGNVMGMMPHPERASENILCPTKSNNSAILIFHSLVSYLLKEQ